MGDLPQDRLGAIGRIGAAKCNTNLRVVRQRLRIRPALVAVARGPHRRSVGGVARLHRVDMFCSERTRGGREGLAKRVHHIMGRVAGPTVASAATVG